MSNSSNQLITASAMAKYCQVDLKTIHNWCERGKLPHFRTPGRHLRFKVEDVLAFLRTYGYTVPPELKAGRPRVYVISHAPEDVTKLQQHFLDEFDFVHHADPLLGIARALGALNDRADAVVLVPPFPGFVCDGLPKRLSEGGTIIPCFGYCTSEQKTKAILSGAHAVITYDDTTSIGDVLRRSLGINS